MQKLLHVPSRTPESRSFRHFQTSFPREWQWHDGQGLSMRSRARGTPFHPAGVSDSDAFEGN